MDDGFAEGVRRFYEAHMPSLYTYALSITGSETAAEDAVHNAMLALLRPGRLPKELRPYAFRCVRNAALDELRHRDQRSGGDGISPKATVEPGPFLESRQDADALLQVLSPEERECVVLKIFADLTFREIAAVRKQPLQTVASQYRRALAKMRDGDKEFQP